MSRPDVLQVTLPTNFKVAKFDDDKDTAILRQLEQEIDAIRFDPGDGTKIELPVKLRVSDLCCSCRWPNGRCCWPAITAASHRTACGRPRRRCTATSRRPARSITSSTTSS